MPKVVVAYTAVTHGPKTADFCSRFVASWLAFPPGVETDLVVICNGGPLPTETALLFASIPKCTFFPRENDPGWDISGYLDLAGHTDAEMLVCMGESVYFHREGWLRRMSEVWTKRGVGMYGFFASHTIRAHLNTSAFACSTDLLRAYPHPVKSGPARYEFEHGQNAFWRSVVLSGRPVVFVTWDGEWLPTQWRSPPNILWRGDQSNLLCWCNHVERYFNSDARARRTWERIADSPFR